MTYTLPQLPYASDALLPVLSRQTIEFHYGKHTKTYIDNLNNLINETVYENMKLEEVVKSASGALYNNAAQVWNHLFYFSSFSPVGGGEPKGVLADAINRDFGSFEAFKNAFENVGISLFGSGWVWLSCDDSGKLYITQGKDASNPLTDSLKPLLCFDVWEHAYYLDYQNRRAESLRQLWKIVDWNIISSRY